MREEDVFEPKNVRDVSYLDRVIDVKDTPAPAHGTPQRKSNTW